MQEAKEGDEFVLTAKIDGSPPPKAIWLLEGEEIKADGERVIITEEESEDGMGVVTTLRITKVNDEDNGKFTLLAKNTAGEARADCLLDVIGKPKPPRVVKELEPKEVTIPGKKDLKLQCKISGYPAPAIKWFRDGNEIKVRKGGPGLAGRERRCDASHREVPDDGRRRLLGQGRQRGRRGRNVLHRHGDETNGGAKVLGVAAVDQGRRGVAHQAGGQGRRPPDGDDKVAQGRARVGSRRREGPELLQPRGWLLRARLQHHRGGRQGHLHGHRLQRRGTARSNANVAIKSRVKGGRREVGALLRSTPGRRRRRRGAEAEDHDAGQGQPYPGVLLDKGRGSHQQRKGPPVQRRRTGECRFFFVRSPR